MFGKLKARYAHPGIYLYRTRKHMRPGTEWGYGGKTRRLDLRDGCHAGRCTRHPGCAGGKPWSDLVTRRYTLELPWYLGWDWITLSMETVLLLITRPRYNQQKNPRRTKVGPHLQKAQRHARETTPSTQDRWQDFSFAYAMIKLAGFVILAGVTGGYLWMR